LLRTALTQFQEQYHEERNRQGKNNVPLFRALLHLSPVGDVPSAVENASTVYSDTTARRMNILTTRDEALDHRNPVKIREREDARVRIRHCTAVDFHCLKHCCCTVSEGLPFPTIATVYPAKRNAEPCMITVPRK